MTIPTNMASLLADLVSILAGAYGNRNTPSKWSAQIESGPDRSHITKANVTVQSVSLEATGFEITVKDAQNNVTTWSTSPSKDGHPIKYDNAVHNEADAIVDWKILDPNHLHIDIRWVSDGGNLLRLDTQYDLS